MVGESERQKAIAMLAEIAVGTYEQYPSHGEYRYPPELRIPAADALLAEMDREYWRWRDTEDRREEEDIFAAPQLGRGFESPPSRGE